MFYLSKLRTKIKQSLPLGHLDPLVCHQRPKHSQNCGLHRVKLLRRRGSCPIGRRGIDHQGEIYIDHMEKGYRTTLCRIIGSTRCRIREKMPFHQDNASAHAFAAATVKLFELGFELLTHPTYAPNLGICGFCKQSLAMS